MKLVTLAKILGVSLFAFDSVTTANAQGTITFNQPWIGHGIQYHVVYHEMGMSILLADWGTPVNMARVGAAGPTEHPLNGTPHMELNNYVGVPQYVILNLTNANSFGLTSVDLADPVAPSLTPITITFNGFMADNTMVSQSFTVGGNGSSFFQTFNFNPSFAWGLTRVEIPSPYWAMDNLVFTTVPEPGTFAFSLLGLAALAWRFRRRT